MMKTKMACILIAAAIVATPALADSGIKRVPCGYQQLSVDTASFLTVPTCTGGPPTMVRIIPEGQAVRYRDDGTAPTATVGFPISVTAAPFDYEGNLGAIEFISQTSGGKVNALFYR